MADKDVDMESRAQNMGEQEMGMESRAHHKEKGMDMLNPGMPNFQERYVINPVERQRHKILDAMSNNLQIL